MPNFQREFRWTDSDKRALFDSIERGYPIGTLLLWKRPLPTTHLGRPIRGAGEAPKSGDVYFLVDGQQRVTTLWESLAIEPDHDERAMVFDLDKGFIWRASSRAEALSGSPPMPLHLALDAAALSEWVPPALAREQKRRYFDVGKRLREALIPIYVIEGDDIEALRVVFDRVNSAGHALTRDEVFDALVGSKIGEGDEIGIGLVHGQLSGLGFGTLERATILKAFEAVGGERIGKLDPRRLDPTKVERGLVTTSHALRRAIVFLRGAGVPHVNVLPYELPLVVLARFFALYQDPSERSLVLLRRWFWRGALTEQLGGASGSLQQHADDVTQGSEHGSVQRLLQRTGRPAEVSLDGVVEQPFSIATARGKLVACALLSRSPRSLLDGSKIEAESLFREGSDKATLRISAQDATPFGSSVTNKLFHPRCGVAASKLIRDCRDEGALASHGITDRARAALLAGDVKGLLEARSEKLRSWIRDHFERCAEWSRDDTPPVAAIAEELVSL